LDFGKPVFAVPFGQAGFKEFVSQQEAQSELADGGAPRRGAAFLQLFCGAGHGGFLSVWWFVLPYAALDGSLKSFLRGKVKNFLMHCF